jgi:hypothetical protein
VTFPVCFHRKNIAEKGHSSSVLRLFHETQSFTVCDVKFVAGNGLDRRAESLSGRVAAVSFVRVRQHIPKPHPNGHQYDYGESGEKVLAYTLPIIIIAFGSCFYIADIPDGVRVAPSAVDDTVLRKCADGCHEFIPDLPTLFRLNAMKINYFPDNSDTG